MCKTNLFFTVNEVIWLLIATVLFTVLLYKIISDRNKRSKINIPRFFDDIKTDTAYDIHLSNGDKFLNVRIIGSIYGSDARFSFAGWEGILVLLDEDKKKIYIKKTAIRFIKER